MLRIYRWMELQRPILRHSARRCIGEDHTRPAIENDDAVSKLVENIESCMLESKIALEPKSECY